MRPAVRCSCMMLHTVRPGNAWVRRDAAGWDAALVTPFSLQVDGMDVLCVREAAKFAADHCRAGKVS